MIRVQTGSRLHFGLLSLPAEDHWSGHDGEPNIPARRFGGVGLMIERPGIRLTIEQSTEWSADGPLAERALACARQFATTLPPASVSPQHIVMESCAPEHAGLGTGTQLGLAVARALAAAHGLSDLDAPALARRVGRATRSALGVHGFAGGGFLVDGGKGAVEPVAPLIARADFPEDWPILVVVSRSELGVHGEEESQIFERIRRSGMTSAVTDSLCRLALLGMLPGLLERDLPAFGEALHDFNVRAGEAFATVQSGSYASPSVAEIVSFIRRSGVRGVGQSSWGPAVFAVLDDAERVDELGQQVRARFNLANGEVFTARARNRGAAVESVPPSPFRQPS